MAQAITVPAAPPLATVPNVEIMHTGQWDISTGRVTVTPDDLRNAVAALGCPAVRRPVLKLGHQEPDPERGMRWDGEPAVGWVANLATAEEDRMLVGDYVGMPGWLGQVMVSAYPDRSAEWVYDYPCQLGHTHPVVVTAVALLGVVPPGIGTLQSLQDVAALYGVAAAADTTSLAGTPVAITLPAKEAAVPNPRPTLVAASVSVEDVRRKYYGENPSFDVWIEEIQLDPLQLIVCNDATGSRQRVPVTVGDGDGEDAVSFGDPVTVLIRYEDQATKQAAAAAGAGQQPIRYASRAESRPGHLRASEPEAPAEPAPQAEPAPPASPADPQTPPDPAPTSPADPPAPDSPAEPGDTPPPDQEEDDMSTLRDGLRQRLGILADDVDDTALLAGLDEALGERADSPPTTETAAASAPVPDGYVLVPRIAWEDAQTAIREGVKAATGQVASERERVLTEARAAGKILPNKASMDSWRRQYDLNPESTRQFLANAPQIVPTTTAPGYPGSEDGGAEQDAAFDAAMAARLGVRVEEFTR